MLPLALVWGWKATIIIIVVSVVGIGIRYRRGEIKRRGEQ
jgi:hypothetical protein